MQERNPCSGCGRQAQDDLDKCSSAHHRGDCGFAQDPFMRPDAR